MRADQRPAQSTSLAELTKRQLCDTLAVLCASTETPARSAAARSNGNVLYLMLAARTYATKVEAEVGPCDALLCKQWHTVCRRAGSGCMGPCSVYQTAPVRFRSPLRSAAIKPAYAMRWSSGQVDAQVAADTRTATGTSTSR